MTNPARFDVHAHFLPPGAPAGGDPADHFVYPPLTHWSPELAIEFMDAHGIAVQLLSLPGTFTSPQARALNDYGAQVVAAHPDRFGLFAALPLGDVQAALEEIDHVYDTLRADGIVLVTNYDGDYLGNPKFEPVFEALNRRAARIFIHPSTPAGFDCVACGRPGPVIEFPFDTCRSVADLLYAGVLERHTDLRIILSHAGGALPALAPRLATIGTVGYVPHPDTLTPETVRQQLSTLYFDTAIAGSAASLLPVLELTSPDHILFGTDFPPATVPVIEWNIESLERLAFIDAAAASQNGRQLFDRFRDPA